jgi:excinuclease UvrABC nuclease subunit
MVMRRYAMKLQWEVTRSIRAAGQIAPASPGVYTIGEISRECGLIIVARWRYVGRATARLNRRLYDHRTVAEKNLRLRNWLASHPADLEVWFASTPLTDDATWIEAHLIKTLNPDFNVLLKPTPGAAA